MTLLCFGRHGNNRLTFESRSHLGYVLEIICSCLRGDLSLAAIGTLAYLTYFRGLHNGKGFLVRADRTLSRAKPQNSIMIAGAWRLFRLPYYTTLRVPLRFRGPGYLPWWKIRHEPENRTPFTLNYLLRPENPLAHQTLQHSQFSQQYWTCRGVGGRGVGDYPTLPPTPLRVPMSI